jgi:mono/diheme cytochrome c family protein
MRTKNSHFPWLLAGGLSLLSGAASAEEAGVLVGDATMGNKLFQRECALCHGADGKGGKSGVPLTDSGRLNLLRDEELYAALKSGAGVKDPKEHALGDRLSYLEYWDAVAHLRTLHMTVADFFPKASRFVSKVYEIDANGLQRIEKAAGKQPKEKSAAVFTFFSFPDEVGALTYVPQDPIKLDQLTKDKKAGYLVFLPFSSGGFDGELGIGMDAEGKITRALVHASAKNAELLNKQLANFVGLGKKGQKEPFKVGGGKPMADLAADVFPAYLRAMETVTMYDREERERTWADEK